MTWKDDIYRRLDEEGAFMHRYFSGAEGANTLSLFFTRAEGYFLTEPAGVLHKDNGTFEFFEAPQKNGEYYAAILTGSMEKVAKLRREVWISYAVNRLRRSPNAAFDKRFMDILDRYVAGENGVAGEAFVYYQQFSSSYYYTPEKFSRNDGGFIEIHIHPHIGEGWGENIRGYSQADKRASRRKSLGLIEYSKNIKTDNGSASLSVDFEIRHRIRDREIFLGTYGFRISGRKMIFSSAGAQAECEINVQKVSRGQAISLLSRSAYLIPFIDFKPGRSDRLEDYDVWIPDAKEDVKKALLDTFHRQEEDVARLLEAFWGAGYAS